MFKSDKCTNSRKGDTEEMLKMYRPVARGGALAPQFFAKQLTLSQQGDRLCPSQYNKPPKFSDLATALVHSVKLDVVLTHKLFLRYRATLVLREKEKFNVIVTCHKF